MKVNGVKKKVQNVFFFSYIVITCQNFLRRDTPCHETHVCCFWWSLTGRDLSRKDIVKKILTKCLFDKKIKWQGVLYLFFFFYHLEEDGFLWRKKKTVLLFLHFLTHIIFFSLWVMTSFENAFFIHAKSKKESFYLVG